MSFRILSLDRDHSVSLSLSVLCWNNSSRALLNPYDVIVTHDGDDVDNPVKVERCQYLLIKIEAAARRVTISLRWDKKDMEKSTHNAEADSSNTAKPRIIPGQPATAYPASQTGSFWRIAVIPSNLTT